MTPRYLLDTNLLVYPHQVTEPVKSARAIAVLTHLNAEQSAALPAQALAVLANVVLKKAQAAHGTECGTRAG